MKAKQKTTNYKYFFCLYTNLTKLGNRGQNLMKKYNNLFKSNYFLLEVSLSSLMYQL